VHSVELSLDNSDARYAGYYIQGWGPLCRFLGKKQPDEPFPVENAAGSKSSITERVIEETWLVKRIKMEAAIAFFFVSVLLSGCVYYVVF